MATNNPKRPCSTKDDEAKPSKAPKSILEEETKIEEVPGTTDGPNVEYSMWDLHCFNEVLQQIKNNTIKDKPEQSLQVIKQKVVDVRSQKGRTDLTQESSTIMKQFEVNFTDDGYPVQIACAIPKSTNYSMGGRIEKDAFEATGCGHFLLSDFRYKFQQTKQVREVYIDTSQFDSPVTISKLKYHSPKKTDITANNEIPNACQCHLKFSINNCKLEVIFMKCSLECLKVRQCKESGVIVIQM